MTERFSNCTPTTLSANITSTQTTISVNDASTYPLSGNFRILVQQFDASGNTAISTREIMLVTAVSGNTFTVTRGAENTTALAYPSGTRVVHGVTAAVMAALGGGGASSPLTTKGDIWGYDSADDRIPIGANNTILTADSTQALGLKWSSSINVAGTVAGSNLSGTNTGDQTNISGNAATVTTNANLTGVVTSVGNATSLGSFSFTSLNSALTGDSAAGLAATQTLTNKRITKRVVTASDATSITPNSDNADITYQLNTQSVGTLTINADGGTPTNGQSWALKIKSTNIQTFSWNAIFKGGTTALPTASTGGSKIDYWTFIYDTVTPAWHFTGTAGGF